MREIKNPNPTARMPEKKGGTVKDHYKFITTLE